MGSLGATRDYKQIAELYCDADGKWTYIPDIVKNKLGGTKRQKKVKRQQTRRL
jgi:hypothetical protein